MPSQNSSQNLRATRASSTKKDFHVRVETLGRDFMHNQGNKGNKGAGRGKPHKHDSHGPQEYEAEGDHDYDYGGWEPRSDVSHGHGRGWGKPSQPWQQPRKGSSKPSFW